MESHPDTWFRKLALPMYIDACKAAADFVHSESDNLVLVRNTTQGTFKAVLHVNLHAQMKCLCMIN